MASTEKSSRRQSVTPVVPKGVVDTMARRFVDSQSAVGD
jgi:hypothetical protein